MKVVLFVFLVVGFFGCDKGAKTPEGLIKKYVTEITTEKVDLEFFEKHTTGALWEAIQDLEEEDFVKFADLRKVKNPKIEISSKICTGDRCTLTYIIKYDVVDKKTKKFVSEVKKVATVMREGEIWKIAEVSNIKTYHESEQPIDALGPVKEESSEESTQK